TCICGSAPARPPSKATIWRVVIDADADVLDAAVASWLMSSLLSEPAGQGDVAGAGADQDDLAELIPVRLDGKTVRGARDAAGNQRHLLSAPSTAHRAVLGGRRPGRGRGQD